MSQPPTSPSLRAGARRRHWPAALLIVLVVLFAVGIVRLFELRFGAGDVYPAYSSLRSDPLGTKVLYESLDEIPGLSVERNLRPLHRLPDPDGKPPAAFFYLAADSNDWPMLFHRDEVQRLDAILFNGGRVIVTFQPSGTLPRARRSGFNPLQAGIKRTAKKDAKPGDDADSDDDEEEEEYRSPKFEIPNAENTGKFVDLVRHWQLDFRRITPKDRGRTPVPFGPAMAADSPTTGSKAERIAWHSAVSFDLDSPLSGGKWRPLLRAEDLVAWPLRAPTARGAGWQALWLQSRWPVIVARDFPGGGRVILATDSYFLSNEALRAEPHPALLAALTGPARRIIFDERHFNIGEDPGLMSLARRFHLVWALGALLALAGLFIWKNMASLVPLPTPPEADASAEPGRDGAAGFLNLLRRGVPAREVLGVCVAQWKSAEHARPQPTDAATLQLLESIAAEEAAKPFHRRELAAAYRRMCEAAKRRVSGSKSR